MGLTLDNQTLLYIIIGLFVIQIFIVRYYVQSTVESNNKKVTKSFTGCIDTTFDKYVGKKSHLSHSSKSIPKYQKRDHKKDQRIKKNEIDSIEDPADNRPNEELDSEEQEQEILEQENQRGREEQENQQEDQEGYDENNEDQEECVTDDN